MKRGTWIIAFVAVLWGLLSALAVGYVKEAVVAGELVPADSNFIVEFVDVQTKVYRVTDGNVNCYIAVGYLHGYTVSIDCVKTYIERVHEDCGGSYER